MDTKQTKSQTMAADIAALLRARNPLLWIVTREESRVEGYLMQAAAAAGYVPRTWDVAQGVCDLAGKQERIGGTDPAETLQAIAERARSSGTAERGAWILRDMPRWITSDMQGAVTQRQMRNLARLLPTIDKASAQAVIVISPNSDVPAELAGHTTVIDWPLPDRNEIADILDWRLDRLPEEIKASAAPNGTREAAIDAAIGLSGEEAEACYAKSLVQTRTIDPVAVAKEKKRVIARERILEWFDPLPGGLEAVGGLNMLKSWLTGRKAAYTKKAREYGLPAPRGVFLVGVPGCGKSLTAKAIATAWGVPLLRLDLGALKSKFVGESESNLRRAFDVIASVGRCVVWLDEIEKGLQGATSGSADGGVSADALGAVLSWMQERSGEAFVVATANDVEVLPPELLRKGRFDEMFFVDTPTVAERVSVLVAALASHKRAPLAAADMLNVAKATEGFTGSEIAALVPDAMFVAFADGERELDIADLRQAAATVVPLTKTAAEKIDKLRAWARGRCRPATAVDSGGVDQMSPASISRQLDI